MANLKFKLNRSGVASLMKSAAMQSVLEKRQLLCVIVQGKDINKIRLLERPERMQWFMLIHIKRKRTT